jgi:hypothetical protein
MAENQGLDHEDFLDRTEPLDTFQQIFSRRTADVTLLGTSVYRECWDEFYRWEPGECQQLIADLPPNSSDFADFEELIGVFSCDREPGMVVDVDRHMSGKVVTMTTYDKDGSFSQAWVPLEEVTPMTVLAPHPTYESCPPTSKNIARRLDEENEHFQTLFIPYADEQEFDVMAYAMECQSFAWQVDWKDPDREALPLLHCCCLD